MIVAVVLDVVVFFANLFDLSQQCLNEACWTSTSNWMIASTESLLKFPKMPDIRTVEPW